MPERGIVRLNVQRGASVTEFAAFLADLENAYVALLLLPTRGSFRRLQDMRLRRHMLIDILGIDLLPADYRDLPRPHGIEIYPDDQLEILRISIQSPGWIDLLGSLNPLQQLREYLKDRHERKKDHDWRNATEKERARLENEALKVQIDRDRVGAIGEFNELLERMGVEPQERQRILWERIGPPLTRLAHHQDTGLLGSQNDGIDGSKG